MSFQKSVSTLTLLSSAVAGIIGSGWLLSPLVCARLVGPAAILSWIIGGLLMMVVASTFVILTRNLPITGGTVRFFQLTHGHFAGFGFSWIAWLAWGGVAPIEALAILQYSANYIPYLMTHTATPMLTPMGFVVATSLLIFIAIINAMGMDVYRRINHFILAFKLIIPITASILLITTQFHAHYFTQTDFMPYGIKSVFAALPLAGVIYSFIGFNPVVQLAAESHSPKQAIPIAIFGALFICMIIYVLVQIAFIAALPPDSMSHGWAHIRFVNDAGPFAGLLALLGFGWFVKLLYVDAAISPLGTALVQALATTRITFAMAQNRYLPQFLLQVNKNGVPLRALILNIVIGFIFLLPFPGWQQMVGFLVSCLVIGYVVGPMSLMVLTKQKPEIFKPLQQCFMYLICFIAFYICNLLIFWSGWTIVYKVLILFAVGFILLFAIRRTELKILRGSWAVIYLMGMGVLSFFSSFGGNHAIPFGIDFLVVAAFTLFIYLIAFYLTHKTTHSLDWVDEIT